MTPDATPEETLAEEHARPHCPHCDEVIVHLAVWIDDGKRSAIFFCASCQRAFGAQLLTGKETHLDA